jgi:hypothetical protein
MTSDGQVTLTGDLGTDLLLAVAEVVDAVPGVVDFQYRSRPPQVPSSAPN